LTIIHFNTNRKKYQAFRAAFLDFFAFLSKFFCFRGKICAPFFSKKST
jgi:hypothetical protein